MKEIHSFACGAQQFFIVSITDGQSSQLRGFLCVFDRYFVTLESTEDVAVVGDINRDNSELTLLRLY